MDTICRTGIGDIRTTTPSPPPLPDVVAIVKDDSGAVVVVPSPPPPPPPAFSISNNMLVTTPSLLRRNFGGGVANGSSGGSPETEEFESLERRLHEELEQKLQERKLSAAAALPEPLSPPPPTIGKPAPWSQPFGGDDADQLVSLQLVEKRQLRSFSRADEYLYAMKEDLGRLQF